MKKQSTKLNRFSRKQYWLRFLCYALISTCFSFVGSVINKSIKENFHGHFDSTIVAMIFIFYICWTIITVLLIMTTIKRLHDINKSGYHALWSFFPFINIIFWIVIGLKKTYPQPNQWGPPKSQ